MSSAARMQKPNTTVTIIIYGVWRLSASDVGGTPLLFCQQVPLPQLSIEHETG
jgi:hypothetical protein